MQFLQFMFRYIKMVGIGVQISLVWVATLMLHTQVSFTMKGKHIPIYVETDVRLFLQTNSKLSARAYLPFALNKSNLYQSLAGLKQHFWRNSRVVSRFHKAALVNSYKTIFARRKRCNIFE